jgi:hypothetical protein
MCPACMATAAVIAVKATSLGGLTAVAVKKLLPKLKTTPKDRPTPTVGEPHEPTQNRIPR